MTRKKRLALAYLLSIGLNVVFWLAYARELRLNAPVPPVTPKSTLHTLTLGIYQPLPAVVKPKPSVSSLSRKKPGGNASQEDPSSAQQLAEAEKSADDAGQKNPSQSKGSADGTRQKGRDHSPASSHSRQSSVLAASALAASAPHFLPSVSAESEKPGEKTASEKTDAGKNAGKRTDARLARLAADLKRLQESRAGNGQPGSDSSQNQSDAAANALADAAGLSSAQLAALPPAQQQALMTALGMAPSSASAGDVDKKDGPDLKTPDAPAAPADKEKPLPQAQNVVLKVVKMWTPKPGQKFNLASNLNLILPPDLELVPGPPLTDDQIEQLRKLLSQQKLKHVTLNKKQLKRLIEAQRVAQNTRKKDTPAPGDDARHRTFKRLAAKPKPHTHVAAAHKPVEALERPNRPQSPFVFKPWNSDMYRRWTPNPAAMASDQHPPVEAPEAPDTPQTPNPSASANTPESGPQQTANAQVSANPQAPGAAAVASAQAAAQNAPSGNSHTNAGQGVLGGQPGSPSAATGQPATPSGAAGNAGKSSQTLGGTSQTTPGQNAGGAQQATGGAQQATGGAQQATGGAQQATGGAQQATGGNQETLGASAATNGGQPANASPTPGTPGTTTAAGNTSPQTGPQGNPPMAGGGGNPPMAGGGGNPPMAGGGGNPPMAGGGGNPPMAGGGGNPPMAGGGGNPPMAGGGGNPPMAGGGGNPPMAGGGGNPPMAGGGGNPPMAGGGGNAPMAGGGGNAPMAGGGGNAPMAGGGGNAPMAGGGGNAPMAGGGGNAPMAGGGGNAPMAGGGGNAPMAGGGGNAPMAGGGGNAPMAGGGGNAPMAGGGGNAPMAGGGGNAPMAGGGGNAPMAGGGGNAPMAGGGGNAPMAGGGGNAPMAGGGGNAPMAGGGGNAPMAGGGGNAPMAGGGGNAPMAGGGGNAPMAGGGGNAPMAGGGGNAPMAGGGGNAPMAGGGGNAPMAGGGGNAPMAGGGGNAPMAGGGGNAPMAGGGGNAPMAGGNSAAASTPGTGADGSLPGMGTGGASSIAGMSAGSPGAPGSPGMTGGVLAQEQSDGIADATGMGNAGDNTDSHDPTGFEPEANPTWPNPPTEDAHSGQHGIPGALILPPSPPMGTETGADPNPHPVKRTIITKPQGRTAVPPPLLAKLPAEPTPTGTEIAPRKKVPTPVGKPKKLALKPAAPALTVGSTSGRGQIAVYVADRPHLPLGAVSDVVDPPLPPALGTPQSRLLAPKRRAARAETADQAHMAVETTPPVLAETPAKAAKRTPLLVRLVKNSSGIKEGTEQPLPPTPLPDSDMQIGDGSGLKADYYLGRNFDQLAFSRADSNINFDFAGMPDGSPSPKIPAGSDYTARWTGKIAAKYSETYTIYASADDGVRIWIDHHLIINDWTPHGNEEFSNKFTFQAGEQYDIKVEYLEIDGGGANLNLYWQSPSQPKQFIPEESFFYPLPTDEDDMKKDKAPGE